MTPNELFGESLATSRQAYGIVGAHPLHALMTLHAVHGEMKRLQREIAVQQNKTEEQ